MDLSVNFENLKFNYITIIFGAYIIILGIIYYLIFHKHHKRNQVDFSELISLLTKYYSLSIISTLLIVFGIYCFSLAHEYSYDRTEVIMYMITGILIISLTIINYIFYIKRNLVDYNQTIREMNKKSMSAQAVGNAVGHNPISIIIPCHRVVGVDGNLTGYAGGIDKKIKLLTLEDVDINKFFYLDK